MSDIAVKALVVAIALALYGWLLVRGARRLYPYVRDQLQKRRTPVQRIVSLARGTLAVIVCSLFMSVAMVLFLWPMSAFKDPPTVARVLFMWAFMVVMFALCSLISVAVYIYERNQVARKRPSSNGAG